MTIETQETAGPRPVVVYPNGSLPAPDMAALEAARAGMEKIDELVVPPRDGRAFRVPRGHFFRILSIEGPQVGDLNLWNAHDLSERFFSGKTRALHATHVTTGHRLWSTLFAPEINLRARLPIFQFRPCRRGKSSTPHITSVQSPNCPAPRASAAEAEGSRRRPH